MDGTVPVPEVRILAGVVNDSLANQRFEMYLLLFFAASALSLAGLGVYGVVTYSVAQRHREIGLRIALGAQRRTVYRLVLRDGLLPVAIGAAAGVVLAFGSARAGEQPAFPGKPIRSDGGCGVSLHICLRWEWLPVCYQPGMRPLSIPCRACGWNKTV